MSSDASPFARALARAGFRPAEPPTFAYVAAGDPATHEGWVERVRRRRNRVDVHLALQDGSPGRLRLAPDCASWLEIEPGQIVALRRHGA